MHPLRRLRETGPAAYSSMPNFISIRVHYYMLTYISIQIWLIFEFYWDFCTPTFRRSGSSLVVREYTHDQWNAYVPYFIRTGLLGSPGGSRNQNVTTFSVSAFCDGAIEQHREKLERIVLNCKPSPIQRYQNRFHIQSPWWWTQHKLTLSSMTDKRGKNVKHFHPPAVCKVLLAQPYLAQ